MARKENFMRIRILGLFVIVAISQWSSGGVVADGAKLELLSDTFEFTEGPACDASGNVYFTDQPNDRIMIWTTAGELKTFLQPCGRSNGLYFDKAGNLWACADDKNELWRIAPDGTHETVLKDHEGRLFNGPNDLWIAPGGGIYFTDPLYERPYWNRGPMEQPCHGVYYLASGAKAAVRVVDDLVKPNGIIGAPDGKLLYVADINDKKTWRYTLSAPGTLAEKTLFCEMGSDGMTVDNAGNVFLTGNGVTVFDAAGAQIAHIDVPGGWTANVCFGGADRQWLFITATKALYRIRMETRGVDRP
jgi:gluconolactonase